MLREELQLLQEQGSYVGEVVKPMDKKKVLVKVCLTYDTALKQLGGSKCLIFVCQQMERTCIKCQ